MFAKDAMRTNIATATINEKMHDVIQRMREHHHRMLPVIDHDGIVQGTISTTSIIHHIIPEYILNGDLKDIGFAPDISFLQQHYVKIKQQKVSDIMDKTPRTIRDNKSLLCVASELLRVETHGYLLVTDTHDKFLGIISTGDVLNRLSQKLEV